VQVGATDPESIRGTLIEAVDLRAEPTDRPERGTEELVS
jgi:hypothetical protein